MKQVFFYFFAMSGITTFSIWVGKLIITKSFDIRIESYKAGLQKEIEGYKSNLSKISLEHQIKFSRLHEDRAEKIKVLYHKVIELERALIFATTVSQGPDFMNDHERDNNCFEKIRSLIQQLDLDRIYFSNSTILKFDIIIKESWEIAFQMQKVRRYAASFEEFAKTGRKAPEIYYSETDLWTTATNRTENEFKVLKEDLANEFRGRVNNFV